MSQIPSSTPIHTLQIGDDWIGDRVGGLGRYYAELLRALPATGTTARGLVLGSKLAASETAGQVTAFAAPGDSMVTRLRGVRRATAEALAARPTDLVVAHFALYAFPILDRIAPRPLVIHFHGPWSGESGKEGSAGLNMTLKRFVEKQVYSSASRLIVLSNAFRQELIQSYKVAEDRIRKIPGGVDTRRFNVELSRQQARQQLGWPSDRPIFLTVRRLVRRMGLEDLIEASRLLLVQHPDALLFIGGSGPLAAELQQRIENYQLEDSVKLLGRIEDSELPVAYRAADMSVVPSQSLEGFGLITLESLASGTPAYVTPVGGLPEVIRPFAPQCVFAGTSSKDIAGLLSDALRDPSSRPTREACRSYATTHFSWSAIALQVRAAYAEVL